MFKKFSYKQLIQYFLQGLLVLAPIVVTAYAIFWVISTIDDLIPIFTFTDESGKVQARNTTAQESGLVDSVSTKVIVSGLSRTQMRNYR